MTTAPIIIAVRGMRWFKLFFLTIHKRTRVPDKETWLEWTGRYQWEEKEKITAEHDVYCDPTKDRVSVYVFKDAGYCRYMCIKFFVKHYISLNKEKVSYLNDLFLPHSRRPSAMFTHPGARFCHTYTRQEGRVARSGHSWSDL